MTSQVSSRYISILSEGIPDEGIEEVYRKLKKERTLRWLFFEKECNSFKEFLELVRSPKNLFYVTIDTMDQALVNIFWLNSRTIINCSFHGAFFRKYLGKSTSIMKETFRWLFTELTFLESLLCSVPITNRLANKFVERVGWIKVGTIPRLIRDTKTANIVAGNIYYITKDEVQDGR